MKTVTLQAEVRNPGAKDTKAARRSGHVPCVMYGEGTTRHFSIPLTSFKELLYVPGLRKAEIQLGGETHSAIVKESQFHGVHDNLLHVDFLELSENRAVRAEIPIHTTGRSKGESSGGILYVNVARVKVKGVPSKLREFIELDVTELELNDSLRISDLKTLYPDLEFHHRDTVSVISVETSRAARAAAAEEAAAAAAKIAAAVAVPVEGVPKVEEGAETPAKEGAEVKKEEGAEPKKDEKKAK